MNYPAGGAGASVEAIRSTDRTFSSTREGRRPATASRTTSTRSGGGGGGGAYYGFSTLLCTPGSVSQEGAAALGTQAGPARIQQVTAEGGFSSFRTVAETPFNLVYEVRA